MKKAIILLALLALCLTTFSCGGGGAGSANVPPGENPEIPTVVQLLPTHYIAQTNAIITLHTKVLDGNGIPVPNTPVIFTNLSPIGVLIPTSANTDASGIATVTLKSTTTGFATVQAEVNTGAGQIRNRKTVYFTTNAVLAVTMSLDVDSVRGNGIYNETSDFTLFNPPPDPDDTVEVLATVYNAGGVRVAGESAGESVSWSADHTKANFLRTETTTNIYGQAKAVVQVTPESIRNTETHVNIAAYAGNGAANMVTLFLRPVTVSASSSSLSANPTAVNPGGTSALTAVVKLSTGAVAPDGTTVNFTTTCGTVTPFAQTTGGVAPATFTVPSTPDTCTVTGTVGGVNIGSANILVTTGLTVQPSTVSVNGATGGPATFTIFGGVPGYTITSSSTTILPVPATVAASGGTFTVTVPAGTAAGSVTLTVRDSVGDTATATLTITAGPAITVVPGSYSVPAGVGGAFDFTITGGAPGYIVTSSNPAAVYDSGAGDGTWAVAASGDTFTANVSTTACPGTTTLTVYDTAGGTKTATIVIVGGPLNITPPSATICEDDATCGAGTELQTFTILGGMSPYSVSSSNVGVIPNPVVVPGPPDTFDVDAIDNTVPVATTVAVTLTVTDFCGTTKPVTVSVVGQ
jgi:adhesin/invasin